MISTNMPPITKKEVVEMNLRTAIKNSRNQESYFSLDELAEIIKEFFYETDLEILSRRLLERSEKLTNFNE